MPYQPNYCTHCGEKVERAEWKLWTSDHFCEDCEGAFRRIDWLPRVWLILGGIGILFGFGSYLKTPEKPLGLTSNQFTASASNKTQAAKNEQVTAKSDVQNSTAKSVVQTNPVEQNQAKEALPQKDLPEQTSPQIIESEPVYFCGAQTKKGSPCTRKVKGGGRCWQHPGLPPILPKEKLAASQYKTTCSAS